MVQSAMPAFCFAGEKESYFVVGVAALVQMGDEVREQLIAGPTALREHKQRLEGFGFGARVDAFVGLPDEESEDLIGEVGKADQSLNDGVKLLQIRVGEQSIDRRVALTLRVGQHALDGQNGVLEAQDIREVHAIYGVQRVQQRLGGEAAERLHRGVSKEGFFALVHEAILRDVGEEVAALLLEGEQRLQRLQRVRRLAGLLRLAGVRSLQRSGGFGGRERLAARGERGDFGLLCEFGELAVSCGLCELCELCELCVFFVFFVFFEFFEFLDFFVFLDFLMFRKGGKVC